MAELRHPQVIAEIGCNHRGEFETAVEMITVAAQFCKVPVVKFQKRNVRELLSREEYEAPHPEPYHSYGQTYGEHREALEFDIETHRKLKETCESFGVQYTCSVWDLTSAREIASLQPALMKIPSACNTHLEMLSLMCDEFGGEIHISLGMTTRAEEEGIVTLLAERGRAGDCVLYHCTSGYPVAFEDVNLLEIPRLIAAYGSDVKGVGLSGHHLGIAADVAALALGADWFERHYTLDRTWRGTDHAASLEPDGLRRLIRDVNNCAKALQSAAEDILPVEAVQRKKLKWDRNQAVS